MAEAAAEQSPVKASIFTLKGVRERLKKSSEWYKKLSGTERIVLGLGVFLAAAAGSAIGGTAGLALYSLATLGKIALTYWVSVRMGGLAREYAAQHGSKNADAWGMVAAIAFAGLGAFGLSRMVDHLIVSGTPEFIHGDVRDVVESVTTSKIPAPSAEVIAKATLNGVHPHQLPNGQWVIHRGGFEYTWDGKTWANPHKIISTAEMVAGFGSHAPFKPESVEWLKSVGLSDNQISAIHAYGFNDDAIAKWKAAGFTPHISSKAELTFTHPSGKVWAWDSVGRKMVEVAPGDATPAPEAAAETATTKACTGLTTVVESKGAHGCDGSEALLMDLAKRLVAAGANADTYEQGTVLDRLVEAQLNGNVARMASVLSQELGMLNPNDHLDSANIWDNARLRVEGTKLTLVGPGTGPNGDLLVDCTKIDGFDGKMIHTTACGEAPAAPAPAPEAPVVTAEVAPEPEVVPPPPEVVPAPTPVPPPEVVTPPADDCYPDQVSRVSVEDVRLGVHAEYPAFEYRGETPAEARTWIEQYFAQHPPQRETTVLLMVDQDCDGHPEYIECVHIRPDGSVRYTDMMSNSSSIGDSRFDRNYNSFSEDSQRRILARDFDRVPGTTTDLRGVAATDPTPDGAIDLPEHESNTEPVASPYAAEATPDPVDANTALVRLGESFDAIPAIDAKIQLIGQYDIQSIMNLDANQIPGLSADQKEAWTAVRRVLLEGRNSGVVPGRHMSLSAFMQQVMGVAVPNTD